MSQLGSAHAHTQTHHERACGASTKKGRTSQASAPPTIPSRLGSASRCSADCSFPTPNLGSTDRYTLWRPAGASCLSITCPPLPRQPWYVRGTRRWPTSIDRKILWPHPPTILKPLRKKPVLLQASKADLHKQQHTTPQDILQELEPHTSGWGGVTCEKLLQMASSRSDPEFVKVSEQATTKALHQERIEG